MNRLPASRLGWTYVAAPDHCCRRCAREGITDPVRRSEAHKVREAQFDIRIRRFGLAVGAACLAVVGCLLIYVAAHLVFGGGL